MATFTKKRKLVSSDQETGSGETRKSDSTSTKRAARPTSSSSSSSSPNITAFSLESVKAGARAATAAALAGAPAGAIDSALADATVHFLTTDRASWVYHVPRWYRRIRSSLADVNNSSSSAEAEEAQWFEDVWDLHPAQHDTLIMFGRPVPTPRFQQAFGESYRFSGTTFTALPVPAALRACVEAMQALVLDPRSGRSFLRGALVNWYANGEHYIGPHSDGESSLLRHSPVLSLSLGAARRFVFSAKAGAAGGSVRRLELLLRDGDLVVMGGTTQQTHKHALPKMKSCLSRRVSVTMRCFK